MSQPVADYIMARIGHTWTVEDAAFVADKIRQIEEVAEGVVRLNQNSRKSNAFAPPRDQRGAGYVSAPRKRVEGD